jgi:pimeloyl-ACP methyl ester carboxylesterase
MQRNLVDIDGTSVAAWESGHGRPVLLLHGLSLDHRSVAATAEPAYAAHRDWRRIYVDLPGMGETPGHPALANATAIVSLLEGVVDALIGTERFAIVGQSYEGYLARGLLARRIEQVIGIALVVPVVEPDLVRRDTPAPMKVATDDHAMSALPTGFVRDFRPFVVSETPEVVGKLAAHVVPGIAAGDAAFIEALQGTGYRLPDDQLPPPFHGPALIVCGRHDGIVGYTQAFALHAEMPRATIAVLDGGGHIVEIEREAAVKALLSDWLDRLGDG